MHALSQTSGRGPALVTGGTGFLGRAVVTRLRGEGRPVRVLARRPADDLVALGVEFVAASVDDDAATRAACRGMETVFHVAAKVGVWGRYADFFRTNVLGTRAVLAGCREHGVRHLVYTSTPSVVYNGRDLAGVDESLPLTNHCPSPYPATKALAERDVLGADSAELRTIALRPHLIWGAGDPHLVPRILARARAGRLRIVGRGTNRVDMVHVENAVDAHLLAERALAGDASADMPPATAAHGRPYFISDGEPVALWDWINQLLTELGEQPVTQRVSLGTARLVGAACELAWRVLPLRGEPPMTRFVAAELAKDHWFDISAARRDLGYAPRVAIDEAVAALVRSLRREARAHS